MSEQPQPPGRLHTAKSLNKAQHDAMCMRAALLARQMPTTSLPGHVVFASGHPGPPLAFAQLSSYGATYGGFGLVKTSRRTWQALSRSGVPVPQSRIFSRAAQNSAAAYAQQIGFPVAVSSPTGTYRRAAHDAESLTQVFATVPERVHDRVLVHSTVPGELLRLLVQGQQVLAVTAQGHRDTWSLEEIDPALGELAIAAVDAIPGLDIASVTITTPALTPDPDSRTKDADAGPQPLVERVVRTPHLRDFAAGSGTKALRLADRLVRAAAQDLGLQLAEPVSPVAVKLRFSGVPDPEAFTAKLAAMTKDLPATSSPHSPTPVTDGAEVRLEGPAVQIGLLITRAISGFGSTDAHMAQTTPVSGTESHLRPR